MKIAITLSLITLLAALTVTAQKTNDAITKQINAQKADKKITLSFDNGSNMSKLMVISDMTSESEAKKAGIEMMNFGMAFFYPGKVLTASPETINITFWPRGKKPKFAAAHNWKVTLASGVLDLGDARYVAKSGDSVEYLNFKISRADLVKIAAEQTVKFTLGTAEFTFTPSQMTTLRNFAAISDSH